MNSSIHIALLWLFALLATTGEDTTISAQIAPGSRLIIDSLPIESSSPSPASLTPSPTHRKLRIWMPAGWSSKTLPQRIIYMLDGQNLFEDQSSFSGEWRLDEELSALQDGGYSLPLVVGIDNGGELRLAEYTVFPIQDYGGGAGLEHLEWLLSEVIPYVESQYGIEPDAAHRGIGGSSLGALLALSAVLEYPENFGYGLLFSPSFWASEKNLDQLSNHTISDGMLLYGLMGTYESRETTDQVLMMDSAILDYYAVDFLEAYNRLRRNGMNKSNIQWKMDSKGRHHESYWGQQSGEAIRWWLEQTR